ncbi:MAG: GntR family transcriptional regulator, partial [Actinobacteria bacterium]|nr:GntR family transcriptional regulator [Actinomycetota bacterium]
RQIADALLGQIESGQLPQADRLPTENELMEQYNASRNTIRDAIKLLTTRGLVETRPGQGTFVVPRISPFVTTLTGAIGPRVSDSSVYIAEAGSSGREPAAGRPTVEVQLASETVADALRLEPGSAVVSRHQARFIDGTPWSLQTTFFPMRLVEQGAAKLLQASNIEQGTTAYLAAECGIKQVGYRDSIAVRPPDPREIAFFRLPPDGRIPVFEIYRIGFDADGGRIRLTVTVYQADRNRFLVNVGQVPSRDGGNGDER